MVKILFCGAVENNGAYLKEKVQSLQNSSHGPFDALICCGTTQASETVTEVELPMYICYESQTAASNVITLSPLIISNVAGLTAVYVPANAKEHFSSLYDNLMEATKEEGYRGVDVMISDEIPANLENGLSASDLSAFQQLSREFSTSSQLSQLVCAVMPRYHFTSMPADFYQRPPYKNCSANILYTRYINLHSVTLEKDKSKKWLHALSVEPLSSYIQDAELSSTVATMCPYIATMKRSASGVKRNWDAADDSVSTPRKVVKESASGNYFFNDNSVAQTSSENATNKRLYVGGLLPRVSNKDILISLPGAVHVNRPRNKPFAFVDFASNAEAEALLMQSLKEGVIIADCPVTIGWAKPHEEVTVINPLLAQSKTLFVGNIPPSATIEDVKLLFPNMKSLHRPEGKNFGFVEFDSNEETRVIMDHYGCNVSAYIVAGENVKLGWAKDIAQTHAQDCWFCLSSPTVKVHLVVSVAEHNYIALAKGPVTENHILIIPIECVPNPAKLELKAYESKIDALFLSNNFAALRFERCIRTKGRDHNHEHNVPIPEGDIENAVTVFQNTARYYRLEFMELQASQDIDELLLSLPNGPFYEYFYIEVPVNTKDRRKFVYVHDETKISKDFTFPMQFGVEVAAKVLKRPEKINWKNCVQSEKAEVQAAEVFRQLFEPYEF